MAPPPGPHIQSAIPSDTETPFPKLVRSSTLPASLPTSSRSSSLHHRSSSHLSPEDAYAPTSPPRRATPYANSAAGNGPSADDRRRIRHNDGSRSRSRRRKRFQKLLWVKQSYPDNYTDQATFLENLQRNPRVRPYDFWPLVADTTVIVQHVCSVIIFIVCFVGIFQERVSPVAVVGWSSFATFVGWLIWDYWVTQELQSLPPDHEARTLIGREYPPPPAPPPSLRRQDSTGPGRPSIATSIVTSTSNLPSAASSTTNLLQDQNASLQASQPQNNGENSTTTGSNGNGNGSSNNGENGNGSGNTLLVPGHPHSRSVSSLNSISSQASTTPNPANPPTPNVTTPPPSSRMYARISTIKSAILIYFTLLGLSPILKSLTRSTSSDSIWAMSFWLLALNIFFFDYSGTSWVGRGTGSSSSATAAAVAITSSSHAPGPGPGMKKKKMPVASLSTNAALMASTVLASRLPSTGQVFSLTLFSIEVFGLFPVFRQLARHRSWRYHVLLTVALVCGAGAGVGIILGDPARPCEAVGVSGELGVS
ncbi:phosphatidylinositol N-acetylglucosaminyltransferase-like protein [Thermochaetoides thermophila DSM 1495]|uniref:Phosphatidylinositol N-acetylglucosaminyltransferase-like protein n=1 Tax=Chaetomium thermophilum (strain DSM 1495 / CBS 144.50 / IMI 039719) TaxID=759272 RepID=G0S1G0_CHATD|nr:phosphatidylinositol N-acetylglucosaminyltransferase-like protein [Thermochaetoides thermophila DSM 1495]EGS22870.1 phosphatidylinositol N-acetylglucosaminyltransferase-like protein [Thermochaetoides thermophila DSM 1495]